MGWTYPRRVTPWCDGCGVIGWARGCVSYTDYADAVAALEPLGWRFGKPASPNDPGTVTCRQCVQQAEVPAEASAFLAGYTEGLRHG